MAERRKELVEVISKEALAKDIFSMWIRTDAAKTAVPGQFISMYTNDGSKLLPRPISICEIDKENGALRVVYRVTGPSTGTEEFSRMQAGDKLYIIGPLGNGFPLKEKKGVFNWRGNRDSSDAGIGKTIERRETDHHRIQGQRYVFG